jgi:hypothetical protein
MLACLIARPQRWLSACLGHCKMRPRRAEEQKNPCHLYLELSRSRPEYSSSLATKVATANHCPPMQRQMRGNITAVAGRWKCTEGTLEGHCVGLLASWTG